MYTGNESSTSYVGNDSSYVGSTDYHVKWHDCMYRLVIRMHKLVFCDEGCCVCVRAVPMLSVFCDEG